MKIGFVSLPLYGHLNPMTALARRMQSRGNEVVFIGVPDVEPFARAAGLFFVPYCEKEYPLGTITDEWANVAKLHGKEVLNHTFQHLSPGLTKAALEHLPQAIGKAGVDALVLDTAHFFLELVPMSLGIPYVHVWNVLNIDFSGTTPPCLLPGMPDITPEGLARNIEGLEWMGSLLAPIAELAVPFAEKAGLQIDWSDPSATTSKLAVVSQTPKELDFPGIPWPPQFHHTGPFHDNKGRQPVAFPWEKLNGKPLVYASMGTLVNGLDDVYKTILAVFKTRPEFQLVLSIGRNVKPESLGPIPLDTILVPSAPQIELLRRATLCITHAGMNTTLESLAQGVPMVAIPIGYDQPGAAARIAYHGAGELIELESLSVAVLAEAVHKVQTIPSYRAKARYFQEVIMNTHGLDLASKIIEKAFASVESSEAAGEFAGLSRS
jgi:zeaxanthin glucosyltransferase